MKGTVDEFVRGHGMRRCRYRGQGKAHIQHVLTAIAIAIERLNGLQRPGKPPSPPTARLQTYLDQHEMSRLESGQPLGA